MPEREFRFRSDSAFSIVSRRDFIKLAALSISAVVLRKILSENSPATIITSDNIVDEIPEVLSKESLRELGIKIYDTPNVSLFLRESAFRLPLFKEIKGKKLGGVNILLVDHHNVGWKTREQMPDEMRALMETFVETPREWSEEKWSIIKINTMIELASNKFHAELYKADPELVNFFSKEVTRLEERLSVVTGDREAAVEFLIEDDYERGNVRGNVLGYFWDGRRLFQTLKDGSFAGESEKVESFFTKFPESKNQAFIFLAVGGDEIPKPQDSFPNIQSYLLSNCWADNIVDPTVDCYMVMNPNPGFTLRHEVMHFSKNYMETKSEVKVDDLALKSIQESWDRREGGNSSSYPFIFLTDQGPVFTHKKEKLSKI